MARMKSICSACVVEANKPSAFYFAIKTLIGRINKNVVDKPMHLVIIDLSREVYMSNMKPIGWAVYIGFLTSML